MANHGTCRLTFHRCFEKKTSSRCYGVLIVQSVVSKQRFRKVMAAANFVGGTRASEAQSFGVVTLPFNTYDSAYNHSIRYQ